MGCTLSSCIKLPSSSKPSKSSSKSSKIKNIKIIHLNGYVEEYDYPVTVAEVTGMPPQHFVFTQVQLLSAGSTPLKQDNVLDPGRVYFLLPYSLFESNVSPVDLAPIARKLGSMARCSRRSKPNSGNQSPSPVLNSPRRTGPNPGFSDSGNNNNNRRLRTEAVDLFCGSRMYSKPRSWKPILDTIREKSFNQKNETDLPENLKVDSFRKAY